MSPLTLTLKYSPKFTLDMSPMTPDKLQNLTLEEIKELGLTYGKETVKVSSLFSVKGSDRENIIINKSQRQLICIGKEMSMGNITVHGDVGDFLGQSIKKGSKITVHGNAGSWVGNDMSGGWINISGNVLHYAGASLPGDAFGMTNGLITIAGSAGDRVGDRMRRGIIIIQGKSGDYCGSRLHAGTIIVLDKVGKHPGQNMTRGTIILAKKPTSISPTFKSCGDLKMQFLRLLFTQLANLDDSLKLFNKYGPEAHRFAGDIARNGKGEILILQRMKKR